ncbi:hypothetical protein [Haploplasma axanthum]|uniref:Uncharacterized protein n=1 Tax=Haploplasma axanthum TaxID=29552 RepID=A0A449BF50_HAPAX|nr:hypothetical protein [Haploplasma axanthum]VEU81069.1 Uncharacterised protein [Haploplasma axanthum]
MKNKMIITINAFFKKIVENKHGKIKHRSFVLPLLLFGLSSKVLSIIIVVLSIIIFIIVIYLTIIFLRVKENKSNYQSLLEYQYDIKNDLLSHDEVKYNDSRKINNIINKRE